MWTKALVCCVLACGPAVTASESVVEVNYFGDGDHRPWGFKIETDPLGRTLASFLWAVDGDSRRSFVFEQRRFQAGECSALPRIADELESLRLPEPSGDFADAFFVLQTTDGSRIDLSVLATNDPVRRWVESSARKLAKCADVPEPTLR